MRRLAAACLVLPIAFVLAVGAGCQTIPATGERKLLFFSEQDDVKLGKAARPDFEKEFGGPIQDPALQAYVRSVGMKVAAEAKRLGERNAGGPLPYEHTFTALESKEVNAFALPGGPVYVTRGLLKAMKTEGQLAAVLGHETGHVYARHGSQQLTNQLGLQILVGVAVTAAGGAEGAGAAGDLAKVVGALVGLKYSRGQESQADLLGLDYMVAAGYAPTEMVALMQVFEGMDKGGRPPEFLSTHPNPENRVQAIQHQIQARNYAARGGRVDEAAYRRQVLDRLGVH
jgi:predicted Zn-dependent protease